MTSKVKSVSMDVIFMTKIDSIIASLSKQDTEIAVLKTINSNVEDHLRTLNGKVQGHEVRMQVQEGSTTVNTKILASLAESAKETRGFWERNWEKFFWTLVVPGIIYFALNK